MMVCKALHLDTSLGSVSNRFPLHFNTFSLVHRPMAAGSDRSRLEAQLNSLQPHAHEALFASTVAAEQSNVP